MKVRNSLAIYWIQSMNSLLPIPLQSNRKLHQHHHNQSLHRNQLQQSHNRCQSHNRHNQLLDQYPFMKEFILYHSLSNQMAQFTPPTTKWLPFLNSSTIHLIFSTPNQVRSFYWSIGRLQQFFYNWLFIYYASIGTLSFTTILPPYYRLFHCFCLIFFVVNLTTPVAITWLKSWR